MANIVAICGLNCGDCKALIATQKNDDSLRKAVAEEWSKAFGHEIKPEDIDCIGCLTTEGPHINYCSVCEIRKCGMEREVENCAVCEEYKCEKLVKFHEQAPEAGTRLEEIRKQKKKQ